MHHMYVMLMSKVPNAPPQESGLSTFSLAVAYGSWHDTCIISSNTTSTVGKFVTCPQGAMSPLITETFSKASKPMSSHWPKCNPFAREHTQLTGTSTNPKKHAGLHKSEQAIGQATKSTIQHTSGHVKACIGTLTGPLLVTKQVSCRQFPEPQDDYQVGKHASKSARPAT